MRSDKIKVCWHQFIRKVLICIPGVTGSSEVAGGGALPPMADTIKICSLLHLVVGDKDQQNNRVKECTSF